jgi:hypothetical protein
MSLYVLGASTTGGAGAARWADAWPRLLGEPSTVFFKNAVEPSYFLHCSSRFASKRPHVAAVLDFGTNLWSEKAVEDLAELAVRSRALGNTSLTVLVAWPRARNVLDTTRVARAAALSGSVVAIPAHAPDLYADAVHPNSAGHRAIANAVSEAVHSVQAKSASTAAARARPRPSGGGGDGGDGGGGGGGGELCFSDARELPIVHVDSEWKLVDEGYRIGAARRHKFGWRAGSRTTPMVLRADVSSCASVVSIGYLKSHREGGHFKIGCSSPCKCSSIRGFHQKEIHPFPVVRTYNPLNASVTETTSFGLVAPAKMACNITISGSRVRVDSFYIREATESDVHNAALSREQQHLEFVRAATAPF